MALLHQATIQPTKLELLAAWLPGRPWSRVPEGAVLQRVAACRFDDPAGEVGIEILLVRAGDGAVHHTPLTYRDAPLAGAEAWLVGTTEHSVLGRRWVYDACGDPVYLAALAGAILTGTGQAEEFVDVDGRLRPRDPDLTVSGDGVAGTPVPAVTAVRGVVDEDPTLVETDSVGLTVLRVLDAAGPADDAAAADAADAAGPALNAVWAGVAAPVPLARLTA
jgi:hypothetical protein